jgi:DNA mismatch repair protein MutS2
MKLFPESAAVQLEFDKVKELLAGHARTEYALERAQALPIHTRRDTIERELSQADAYRRLLVSGQPFPNDAVLNLRRELRLLGIPGAVLTGEDFVQVRRLVDAVGQVFRWFDADRREAWPTLYEVVSGTRYERSVQERIDAVMDAQGQVHDAASPELQRIRSALFRKRGELRRSFDRILQKLAKAGYVADIEEAFLNGRRVVAVHAEHKRQVKGILHGESDTRRTSFVEPEETIDLNNDVYSLENEERAEVHRILRELTRELSVHAPLLRVYHDVLGEYDFIRAKARLALDMDAARPQLAERSGVHLVRACHPLLLVYHRRQQKPVVPVDLLLDDRQRIIVISGPNAGGKTVTMKTVGLQQLMVQAGLLVPAHPDSRFGIFKQLMIHIGDTQSLEFELSTYSSHLRNMKRLMEDANGRTLFFIDELGSGSDPGLGGAFAEVFLEELGRRHAMGIVTTHYLNLKVMAGKTPGIVNAAMAFDEQRLMPLYRLNIGKPGSSYTFSIAERIGLEPRLIQRARELVDEGHVRLDRLLHRTEQDLRKVAAREKELEALLRTNEALRQEMAAVIDRERHRQEVELLRQRNRITEERMAWLKDMERKLRQVLAEWRRTRDTDQRGEIMKRLQVLLSGQQERQATEKVRRRLDARYEETGLPPQPGDKVLMRQNNKVGILSERRGRKAIVQLGALPLTVDYGDLVAVRDKPSEEPPAA